MCCCCCVGVVFDECEMMVVFVIIGECFWEDFGLVWYCVFCFGGGVWWWVVKMLGIGGSVVCEYGVIFVIDCLYVIGDMMIQVVEIYFVDGVKLCGIGLWFGEVDKVVWWDLVSGYECIMFCDGKEVFFSGYVGIFEGYLFWGWDQDVVVLDFGIEVYGGLIYLCICDEGGFLLQCGFVMEFCCICYV